jgi:hypothetical protein
VDVDETEAISNLRETAVRLTSQQIRSSKRITMRDEEKRTDLKNEKSDDSSEYGDQVGSLPG